MVPPPFPLFAYLTITVLVHILQFLQLVFDDIISPPPFPTFICNPLVIITSLFNILELLEDPLIARLFPGLIFSKNNGRDVWTLLEADPPSFWYITGETPQSLDTLVQLIAEDVQQPRLLPRPPTTNRKRQCLLDTRNRVLLVVLWLRSYPNYAFLALLFELSKSTVADEIYHIVPIIFVRCRRYIRWHSLVKWSTFLGDWPTFANAVGCIDATIHRVRRPTGHLQAEFYRGDKKCHFMSTQLVVDTDGLIVMLVSGYPGHLNDARSYHLLPRIGFNGPRPLPRAARLLADGGYAARVPLVTPRRLARRRRIRQANRELRRLRVRIEHSIGALKIYKSISSVFRQKRAFLPIVVATCCFLTNRRRRLIQSL